MRVLHGMPVAIRGMFGDILSKPSIKDSHLLSAKKINYIIYISLQTKEQKNRKNFDIPIGIVAKRMRSLVARGAAKESTMEEFESKEN